MTPRMNDAERDDPSAPEVVARRMIERYGRDRAAEYAHGYAVGVYFNQTDAGRAHWMKVGAAIKALGREP